MFLQVSVILSTGGGVRGYSGGCAWLLPGGVRGCSGGRAWDIRRDTEIRSMSGRYASYWNAFLFEYKDAAQIYNLCKGKLKVTTAQGK